MFVCGLPRSATTQPASSFSSAVLQKGSHLRTYADMIPGVFSLSIPEVKPHSENLEKGTPVAFQLILG